jgi:small subunit ribosomal protein S1
VLAIDQEKRQIKLSIKQLAPTGLDDYLAEHKPGDLVTGRIVDVPDDSSKGEARVELGEGVYASWQLGGSEAQPRTPQDASPAKADLSSLSSMLQARWKGGTSTSGNAKDQGVAAGQIRSFRIAKLDAAAKRIELESA